MRGIEVAATAVERRAPRRVGFGDIELVAITES